jgi:hypothetical protein
MLLGNLYTALCSCLLNVTCYVDADKCRLPQLLFWQHCVTIMLCCTLCSEMLLWTHVVLWVLCPAYAADFGVTPICPLKLAYRKESHVAWSYWKTDTNWDSGNVDVTPCCYARSSRTLEGSPGLHCQRPNINHIAVPLWESHLARRGLWDFTFRRGELDHSEGREAKTNQILKYKVTTIPYCILYALLEGSVLSFNPGLELTIYKDLLVPMWWPRKRIVPLQTMQVVKGD